MITSVRSQSQKLTILGIMDRPRISFGDMARCNLEVTGDEAYTREHFEKLVLIEAIVEGLDGPFEMGAFGQMQLEFPNDPKRI